MPLLAASCCRILSGAATPPIRVKMTGLEEDAVYTDAEGKSFTGAYLMSVGLILPISTEYTQDFPSRIFHLK